MSLANPETPGTQVRSTPEPSPLAHGVLPKGTPCVAQQRRAGRKLTIPLPYRSTIATRCRACLVAAVGAQPQAQPQRDAPKQELGQLDASPTLFAEPATINAARYNDGIDSPHWDWLRKTVRAEGAKVAPVKKARVVRPKKVG